MHEFSCIKKRDSLLAEQVGVGIAIHALYVLRGD